MWPFDNGTDNVAEQVDIYDKIIEEKQESLSAIESSGQLNNPNFAQAREKLIDEIRQAKIQRSELINRAEEKGYGVPGYERD